MNRVVAEEKEALRRTMKMRIKNQKGSERRKRSKIIQEKIFCNEDFLTSGCVMLYVSKGTGEVETSPIIKKALKMGKKVVLPVTLVREKNIKAVYLTDSKQVFKKGLYGIYEPRLAPHKRPARLKDIDLVIAPGLAFDRGNNRLGRGQGYYDNFLKRLPHDTPRIGLGFRFQLFDEIPATKKDILLTTVITD
jgi:5-formyltetrahydrofolate cyclo-ligase